MTLLFTNEERTALKRAVKLLQLEKGRFFLAALAGSAGLGSAVALAGISAWLIAFASQMPPVMALTAAAVGVRFFGISRALLRYAERLASHNVALRSMSRLRQSVYEELAAAPINTVASIKRGDLLARTGADVDAIGEFIIKSVLPALVALTVGTGTVITIAFYSPIAAGMLAVCLLLSGLVGPSLTMRSTRIAQHAMQDSSVHLAETSLTITSSVAEIQVASLKPELFAGLQATENALAQAKDQAAKPAALAATIDNLSMLFAVLSAIAIGIPEVLSGALPEVGLAVIVLTPLAAFEASSALGPAAAQAVHSARAAMRIIDLLPVAADAGHKPIPLETHAATAVGQNELQNLKAYPISVSKGLVATNLQVGWPQGPTVATGIDLHLTPGKSIAMVGASGIGKSTLLYSLAGLIPCHGGNLTIDGIDLNALEQEELFTHLSLTAEDAHIFATTIFENIRVANKDVTTEQAIELLGLAGLGKWYAALPNGLDTMLGLDQATLSGGERRRLLLARALASPAQYLLLDEPGENLDPATADTLITDLLKTSKHPFNQRQRGVILVTHRLNALDVADEVIILGGSRPATVTARGKHTDLLEQAPVYRFAHTQGIIEL